MSLQLKLPEVEVSTTWFGTGRAACLAFASAAPAAVMWETGAGAFTSAGPVRWIGVRTETGAGAFTRAAPLSWIRDWTETGAGAFTSAAPVSRTGDWDTGLACATGTTTAANARPRAILLSLKCLRIILVLLSLLVVTSATIACGGNEPVTGRPSPPIAE